MNQQQIDKIRETVNTHGIIKTLNLFGDNKDIIRQAYIDNPESYLDYLIDNLTPMDSSGYVKKEWTLLLAMSILYSGVMGIALIVKYLP